MTSIAAFAGNVPRHYDAYLGPLFFEPYAVDLVARMEGLKPHRVLELACGTGRVTAHLVKTLPASGGLTATDLNEAMLAVAREKVADHRVRWQTADAQDLPFGEAAFDAVICQYGVMFFPDKPKSFREALRVLKAGGTFLFNTWDRVEKNALAAAAWEVLHELFPDPPPAFLYKGPHSFYDTEEIRRLLSEAGFAGVTIEPVSLTTTAATALDAVNGIIDGTPVSAFLQQHEHRRQEVKLRLQNLLQERYGLQNLALPMKAFVCRATKP